MRTYLGDCAKDGSATRGLGWEDLGDKLGEDLAIELLPDACRLSEDTSYQQSSVLILDCTFQ